MHSLLCLKPNSKKEKCGMETARYRETAGLFLLAFLDWRKHEQVTMSKLSCQENKDVKYLRKPGRGTKRNACENITRGDLKEGNPMFP
jgi:hypothetical protein